MLSSQAIAMIVALFLAFAFLLIIGAMIMWKMHLLLEANEPKQKAWNGDVELESWTINIFSDFDLWRIQIYLRNVVACLDFFTEVRCNVIYWCSIQFGFLLYISLLLHFMTFIHEVNPKLKISNFEIGSNFLLLIKLTLNRSSGYLLYLLYLLNETKFLWWIYLPGPSFLLQIGFIIHLNLLMFIIIIILLQTHSRLNCFC